MSRWVVEVLNPSLNILHGELGAVISDALKAKGITYTTVRVSYEGGKCSCKEAANCKNPQCTGDVYEETDGFSRGMCEGCSLVRCDLPEE